MHAARIAKSQRLQRVCNFLNDGKWHSTMEIIRKAKVCAVSAITSELRANGLDIECERRGNRWYHRMAA